uniref:Phenoloxidase-activating factor 2 n=1 Tax=Anopheles dirus TaxID=7168 RepID=A0A3F2YW18_9DIPT
MQQVTRTVVVWLALVVVLMSALPDVYGQKCDGRCVPIKNCLHPKQSGGGVGGNGGGGGDGGGGGGGSGGDEPNDDDPPLVDLRVGLDVVGDCPHYLDVCCNPGDIVEAPDSTGKTSHEEPHQDTFASCGLRNSNGVGFRIGAGKVEEAEFGEFPWSLLVLEKQQIFDFDDSKEVYACVASLLAPNVALTVAHCVNGKTASALVVRAGEWDTRTDSETLPYQDNKVQDIRIHEQYNKHHHFDVALLVLERPFLSSDNVQTICLPPPGLRPTVGTECLTGGWGKDRFGEAGVYQQILKRVTLPIVDGGECQQALRRTRLGAAYKLHSSFLCAGGKKDADVCSGDGGAALVCLLPGSQTNYYQAGVVAWGIGCGDEHIPGVYADVDSARPWIVRNLNALNVDPKHYTATVS